MFLNESVFSDLSENFKFLRKLRLNGNQNPIKADEFRLTKNSAIEIYKGNCIFISMEV